MAKRHVRQRSASSSPAKASFDDARDRALRRAWQCRGARGGPGGHPDRAARSRRDRRRPRAQRPGSGGHGRPAARDGGRRGGDRQRQHGRRGRRLRLCGGVPVDDRRRAGHLPGGRRMGARRARRRADRLAATAARRTPAARRGRHDDPRLPRLARLADGRLRPGARPERHHRARGAHGRARHRLRAHPSARGARPRLEAHRQQRLGGLHLRRRADRVVGAHRRRGRARSGPRSSARNSTRSRSPTRSPRAAWPGDVYRAATVRTGKLVR